MTRDDYIQLHRDTVAAIDLVEKHGADNCLIECSENVNANNWHTDDSEPFFNVRYYRARLKPKPKLVPWSSLEEVPLTHWFRWRGMEDLLRVEGFNPFNAALPIRIGKGLPSFQELLDHYEHAVPCDKYSDLIWLPCGKEIAQ